jgi:hypothetical protein
VGEGRTKSLRGLSVSESSEEIALWCVKTLQRRRSQKESFGKVEGREAQEGQHYHMRGETQGLGVRREEGRRRLRPLRELEDSSKCRKKARACSGRAAPAVRSTGTEIWTVEEFTSRRSSGGAYSRRRPTTVGSHKEIPIAVGSREVAQRLSLRRSDIGHWISRENLDRGFMSRRQRRKGTEENRSGSSDLGQITDSHGIWGSCTKFSHRDIKGLEIAS